MSPAIKSIELSGILDGPQAKPFHQMIDDALRAGADIILVDLKDVKFVDSSGLGALVTGLKAARAANKKMYFCSINDQIRMLFELTSMDQVFEVFADRDAFHRSMLVSR
ncbi:MAG: STAS domain-containing protein [Cyanothece sp. SIO1E1]|nr:STAS domain-containing protein [Cyanothece sp. SIO1E1]